MCFCFSCVKARNLPYSKIFTWCYFFELSGRHLGCSASNTHNQGSWQQTSGQGAQVILLASLGQPDETSELVPASQVVSMPQDIYRQFNTWILVQETFMCSCFGHALKPSSCIKKIVSPWSNLESPCLPIKTDMLQQKLQTKLAQYCSSLIKFSLIEFVLWQNQFNNRKVIEYEGRHLRLRPSWLPENSGRKFGPYPDWIQDGEEASILAGTRESQNFYVSHNHRCTCTYALQTKARWPVRSESDPEFLILAFCADLGTTRKNHRTGDKGPWFLDHFRVVNKNISGHPRSEGVKTCKLLSKRSTQAGADSGVCQGFLVSSGWDGHCRKTGISQKRKFSFFPQRTQLVEEFCTFCLYQ